MNQPNLPGTGPAPAPEDQDLLLADQMAPFYGDPLGFVLYAFPWGSERLSGEDGPDKWQREVLEEIGRAVRERNFDFINAVEPIRMARASGHGIGKSALVAWIILWVMSTRVNARGTVTANTATQLETKTWSELNKWARLCITGHWMKISAANIRHKDHPMTWRIDAVTCEERNSEAFAGQHAADSSSIYIFDEASAVPDKIWEVAEGGLTDGEPMFFAFGNPTRNSGKFREIFGRLRHRWNAKQIDSRDTKKANKTLIEQWRSDYGEDSDFFRVRVKGDFPRAGSTQFISSEVVAYAKGKERDVPVSLMDPMVIGVDVARFGDDQSVIFFRRGLDARSIPMLKFRGLDTMQLAARVAEAWERFKADAIFVDETGVGAGVVDRLRYLRLPVTGVNNGAKPDRTVNAGDAAMVGYADKVTEMAGVAREWLKYGIIPDDRELVDGLTNREYGYVIREGKDVMKLEKKDDMKKRGLASPDEADAFYLTFAYPVGPSDHRGVVKRGGGGNSHQTDYDPMAQMVRS